MERLSYRKWKCKTGLVKNIDKGIYEVKGNIISVVKVLDMYKVYCNDF
jgi:hypothetical protein